MTDNEYSKARKAAVDALIYWAKTGMREFTMRDAVTTIWRRAVLTAPPSVANRPSLHTEKMQPTDWRLTAYTIHFAIRLLTFPLFHRFY